MGNAGDSTSAATAALPGLNELAAGLGAHLRRARGWYTRAVHRAFQRGIARWASRRAEVVSVVDEHTARGEALRVIRATSLKSAGAGAAVGAVATGGAVLTAETCGWGALAAVPLTAAAIGGEMLLRTTLHVDMACHLAEIYGVPFDPADEDDLLRLNALFCETCPGGGRPDRGRGLLEGVAGTGVEQLGENIGGRLLEDALMRDVVPFVAVFASAIGNYVATRRLGHTIRRYMRYERAIRDAMQRASGAVMEHLDLLVEGIWYVFVADGSLTPEEAAAIARLLRPLDPSDRARLTSHFVEDEPSWLERIRTEVGEGAREAFLAALEVAAAVDKKVGIPERRILRRVAEVFGRTWDPRNVERLVDELQKTGVAAQDD